MARSSAPGPGVASGPAEPPGQGKGELGGVPSPAWRSRGELRRSCHIGGASIYPFVQNIVLGLRAEGLGTTLSTVLVPVEAEVKHLLRLPDGVAMGGPSWVGWPAGALPTRLSHRPVADFATVDRLDGELFWVDRL
jgi:hypothetical protein